MGRRGTYHNRGAFAGKQRYRGSKAGPKPHREVKRLRRMKKRRKGK